MNIIKIENVTKTFDDFTAVDDLSLSVPKGSIYGFIGPNGSGKTTTLRMIMRILHPDIGRIRDLWVRNRTAPRTTASAICRRSVGCTKR